MQIANNLGNLQSRLITIPAKNYEGTLAGTANVTPDSVVPGLDLPAFVLGRLRAAGVGTCEWIGRDTCAEPDHFFSNRRAFKEGEADYGRLLSAIALT